MLENLVYCFKNIVVLVFLWLLVKECCANNTILSSQIEKNVENFNLIPDLKRGIPYNRAKRSNLDILSPVLTTSATPQLTTIRYFNKSYHQHQINFHHRNYELDLERDHALPTSAPNADILKSNSNPMYPNPNRHHGHDRERHRTLLNSTAQTLQSNSMKNSNKYSPTIAMYPGEHHSHAPPVRSFFTPPLPPEYQHPFADKPTLRGSNNDVVMTNSGTYINRRPIPPPSLMPGHERIPFRPPEFSDSHSSIENTMTNNTSISYTYNQDNNTSAQRNSTKNVQYEITPSNEVEDAIFSINNNDASKPHVIPSIRRILSGSNEKKSEVPEVLLKQVTKQPLKDILQPTTSPVLFLDNMPLNQNQNSKETHFGNSFKNRINSNLYANHSEKYDGTPFSQNEHDESSIRTINLSGSGFNSNKEIHSTAPTTHSIDPKSSEESIHLSSTPSIVTSSYATWAIAWNVHVYLSVILFTILCVYSSYKMLTYNKLTFLFSQSYFICVNLILICICFSRIFYLCYDAYNLQDSFHSFISDILLNLPATFLSTSFAVLIVFLFLKSLNHKSNRYSALIRPLTVVIGCGVHIILCITLHYVESYTTQYQQQQYQQFQNQRRQLQLLIGPTTTSEGGIYKNHPSAGNSLVQPARVLSLICQIIYIFVCLSLGLSYMCLYRVLKRILQSKSQNYIHGHQTLSYGIHITIATALLFILLGALQIFGAISISTHQIAKSNSEMDWLQWGYQFSLRLVEIAIITLLSWVAGLKVNNGRNENIGFSNGSVRITGNVKNLFGNEAHMTGKDKRSNGSSLYNHNNLHGFFFPCASSSKNDQMDPDYPAVCNANTNLHNYTMRTGKLIYDDTFALNSFSTPREFNTESTSNMEFQISHTQSPYQFRYKNEASRSTAEHPQGMFSQHLQTIDDCNHYSDCLTDTTDHYENPNFDLQSKSPQKKSRSSKVLHLQGQTHNKVNLKNMGHCYSEPMHDTNNLEAVSFHDQDLACSSNYRQHRHRKDVHIFNNHVNKNTSLEFRIHEKQKKRNCGGIERFDIMYNSMDRPHNDMCGTIVSTSDETPSSSIHIDRSCGVLTHGLSDAQNQSKKWATNGTVQKRFNDKMDQLSGSEPDIFLKQTAPGRYAYYQKQDIRHNSDEEEMISENNIECTNLISNENLSCVKNSSSSDQGVSSNSSVSEKHYQKRRNDAKSSNLPSSKAAPCSYGSQYQLRNSVTHKKNNSKEIECTSPSNSQEMSSHPSNSKFIVCELGSYQNPESAKYETLAHSISHPISP